MIQRNEIGPEEISGKLITYLRDALHSPAIDYTSPLTQLKGGFETFMYYFNLKNVKEELNKRLVLRLFPEHHGPDSVLWEATIQNTLADEGYPVPRAHLICTDKSKLGGVFFIMEFLPGETLMTDFKNVSEILGKTHTKLHKIDPKPLIKALKKQGFKKNQCFFKKTFDNDLKIAKSSELPWVLEIAEWLLKNRPPEPKSLAICHGDFHPYNILIQEGKISGVLDWGSTLIADPAMDIANTIKLITIFPKHLPLGPGYESVDWDKLSRLYLDAYRAQIPLNDTIIDYYGVVRSLTSLLEGVGGNQILRHPPLVKDLLEFIYEITGIRIPESLELDINL
ncbi:MAG: phosphotransferase family protein [Promethearchaeota archaeon]|jgi:aminoglycoside phosphotransferase (APT) family kinase protein